MVKLIRASGILKVILTCVTLRIFLIYFTVKISNFSKLNLPKYQYNVSYVNKDPFCNNSSENTNCVNKTCKLKSKTYLKGEYRYPTTTIFGFLDNNNLSKDQELSDNVYDKSVESLKKKELVNRNYLKLIGFNSWDSERFLKNTLFNLIYTSEESCAFFPFFSYLLKLFHSFFKRLTYFRANSSDNNFFLVILIGLVFNNFLSVLNNVLIYVIVNKLLLYNLLFGKKYGVGDLLTDNLLRDNKLSSTINDFKLDDELISKINNVSYLTCFVFNLSPGFIFTTSLYTEPLYSLLYYSIILILLDLYYDNLNDTPNFNSLKDNPKIRNKSHFLNRAEKREEKIDSKLGLKRELKVLLMVFLIFLSGFVRSNGLLMILFVFFYKLNNCPLTNYLINKNISKVNKDFKLSNNSETPLGKTLVEFTFYWLTNLFYLILCLTPFALTQLYGYLLYCHKLTLDQFVNYSPFHKFVFRFFDLNWLKIFGNSNTYPNELCKRDKFGLILIYKYIQSKYWFIKLFFSFDNWNNFVNFTYSFPTVLFLAVYLFRYFTRIAKFVQTLTNSSNYDNSNNYDNSGEYHSYCKGNRLIKLLFVVKVLLNNFEFNIAFHLVVLLFSFLLYSHLQIIFRQSLCIIQYFIQFTCLLYNCSSYYSYSCNSNNNNNNCNNNNNNKKRMVGLIFYFYNVILCFTGIILFSNFIGWT